jgi:vancomycin resistance protein YoaR
MKFDKIILGVFFIALFTLSLIGSSFIVINSISKDKIFPQTFIDGADVGLLTKEEATNLLLKKYPALDEAIIEVVYKDQKIATFSGTQLSLSRNINEKVDQAFLIGRSTHFPSQVTQQLNAIIRLQKYNFTTSVDYLKEEVENFVLYAQDTYDKEPQNALFDFQNNKVLSFQIDRPGLKIKSEEFVKNFENSLTKISFKNKLATVELLDEIIEAEVKLSDVNSLGIRELIGEGKSNYTGSIPNRIHNLKLSGAKFHGVIVHKGDIFSFNNIVGEISSRTGYRPAYIIQNGRTVLGDGGGVCQVSTTIFRAALNTGLPIISRKAHGYRVSYYENDSEPGLDATVFSPSVDLQFENNTPTAILIQLQVDEGKKEMIYKFYGQKDGRSVNISPVTVWDVSAPPAPHYQDDPTLPNGVVKQVDWSAWGAKAKFEYKVTSNEGALMIDEMFYSNYRPWRAVFLKGTGSL